MTDPVTLAQVKADLRLGADPTDEDALLQRYLIAARRKVELDTGRTFNGDSATLIGDDAVLAGMAISALVAHWYAHPEAVATDVRTTPTELPLSVSWILASLSRWDHDS